MMFREFAVSDRWWLDCWGGGHTPGTDPVSQGWRAYPVPGTDRDVVLIGRTGQPKCATVVRMGKYLDVALYDETPEGVKAAFVAQCLRDLNPRYIQTDFIPGWGLEVIAEINPPVGLRRSRPR